MDAIRNTYSTVKRCRKAVWRSVKNNSLLSSFRRRRKSTTKCSPENSFDGMTATAQENIITLNEKLSEDMTIDGRNKILVDQTLAVVDLTKRKEKKEESILSDIQEGQSQNMIDEAEKKTRKRRNRRRRKITKASDEMKPQDDVIVEDDRTKLFGLSSSSSVEKTVSVETVTKISLRDGHNETGISEIGECGNKYNDDSGQHSQMETASATTVSWRVKPVDNNEHLECRKFGNGNAGPHSETEINKNVRSILNKITPENIDELIKSFMDLPINTIERMENVVDLVFERAIQEQGFAPLYVALCSAMQSVQVTCARSNKTTSFKLLMINKCQNLLKSDKYSQTSSVKKLEEIYLCRDPEKKKELTFEYRENKRKLHKRSVGNCCFIGQLFNQRIINLKMMQYCIAYLICQHSDDQIECLCNLLRTCGKELEQLCNLNDTFNSLKALAYLKSLSLRIRFMIQNTVELRKNKWLPRRLDNDNDKTFEDKKSCSGSINRPAAVVVNVVPPMSDGCKQTRPQMNFKKSGNSLKITERVELDPAEINDKIRNLCSDIIKEYEELNNLDDVIYSLVKDEKSCIRMRHQHFVTTTLVVTLDCSPNSRGVAGRMFAELLVKNVLTTTEISRGINTVLEEWKDYVVDYPNFFSYVAAIVAPLLTSKTASFNFYNLKSACSSIRRNNNSSEFFVEVLKTILRSEDAQNVEDDFGGALRAYYMWSEQSKYVPLGVFIPDNEINKFFKNDQLGVLLLSMAMFDITYNIEVNKPLYKTTHKWIRKNINIETVKLDDFVRSLTVATAIVCSKKLKDDPNHDFFDRDRGVLIKEYIRSIYDFSTTEIRAREVQCVRGSRAISAALREEQKSEELELRLLRELYRVQAISSDLIDS